MGTQVLRQGTPYVELLFAPSLHFAVAALGACCLLCLFIAPPLLRPNEDCPCFSPRIQIAAAAVVAVAVAAEGVAGQWCFWGWYGGDVLADSSSGSGSGPFAY